ncbi:MAG: Modification methylase MjaV [Methanosaeta sp. PtaU1.Bin112]|nr:MAG: Modification methylase MjaV [Methanosaeta sp. PtaU1.Bin112]
MKVKIDEIYQGDCLELLPNIPDMSMDMVLTDPPYSSGGMASTTRARPTGEKYTVTGTKLVRPDFLGDNRDQRSFMIWCSLWMAQCYKKLKDGGLILCFTDWRQLPTISDAIQVAGFVWRGIFVWDKTEAARPDKGRFRHQCEYIVYASKGPFRKSSKACLPGVFRKAVNSREKFHQAGKPVELIEELLRISPPEALILDPFIGSGTTAVACLRTGRHFMGFELSEEYYEIAARRIAAITQN